MYLAATKIVAATDLIKEQIDGLRARIIADPKFETIDSAQLTSDIFALVDEAQGDEDLLAAIDALDAVEIFKRLSNEMTALDSVGTTAVLALLSKEAAGVWGIHVGNLGDPRAYLFHGGVLQVLTTEHSPFGYWLRRQGVTGDALAAPMRALPKKELREMTRKVTSWVGRRLCGDLMAYNEVKVQPPFVLILCTDGVWKYLAHDQTLDAVQQQIRNLYAVPQLIADLCRRSSSATELCEALMKESQDSSDDRSCLVVWAK